MFGNVVGAGLDFHQISSVKLSASRRSSSMSLTCEDLSPPANRMINAEASIGPDCAEPRNSADLNLDTALSVVANLQSDVVPTRGQAYPAPRAGA